VTADISRHSLRPAQKFTGVVRQQGRIPLDADENEADDLAALALREVVAETICARGSPDMGFAVGAPTWDGALLDFGIAEGSFYLGGTPLRSPGHRFQRQPDWLSFALDAPGPPAPAGVRTDLVWLEGFDQVVTATEDSELFERALGGPDTTARRRTAYRVRVQPGVADDCVAAFQETVAAAFPGGRLDAGGAGILSDVYLQIGFTRLEPLDDLCRPSAQQGFLGARNECFRVQITRTGRFVWGRDNAAPLYRVQVAAAADGSRSRIVFLTPPRDEFGWPAAGMTVELLRWGSLLHNMEKAAEPQGLLLRVGTGFDPADRSIHVLDDVPIEWEDWFTEAPGAGPDSVSPRDDVGRRAYFFLRVWTGGGAGTEPDHAIDVDNPVALGDTGLTARFSEGGMAGDYWIVSARPNTPTEVTPWTLLDGARPAGPRRLAAPLALLRWQGPAAAPVAADCRHLFRPLCQVGGCCRVTVGDGRHSFGDVTSIQAAVDLLPEDGGEICVHPGEYREYVVIHGRRNIIITGCGRSTVWLATEDARAPLLTITASRNVLVRRLAMVSRQSEAVDAEEVEVGDGEGPLHGVTLEDLEITCADTAAVRIAGGVGHVVRRCRLLLEPTSLPLADDPAVGRSAALFISGEDLLVEHNRIGNDQLLRRRFGLNALDLVDPLMPSGLRVAPYSGTWLAAGGVQIGGDSRGVVIRDNRIQGGNGHGITLGSVQYVPPAPAAAAPAGPAGSVRAVIAPPAMTAMAAALPARRTMIQANYRITAGYGAGAYQYLAVPIFVDPAGCIRVRPTAPPRPDLPAEDPLVPESAGLVRDVRIHRNEITDMGLSGISACAFSGLGSDGFSDAIAVELLDIADNRILRCMRNETGETTPRDRLLAGWGGIALSVCNDATIRDNSIADNGARSAEAICGIFIAVAEDVKIERNRIERNGMPPGDRALAPGTRGGIMIGIAVGGVATYSEVGRGARLVDRPALAVSGNIVDAPSGRALRATLAGPGIVLGNRLTGAGRGSHVRTPPRGNNFYTYATMTGRVLSSRADVDPLDFPELERLAELVGGDAVKLASLCIAEELEPRQQGRVGAKQLRGGELMINDNQISLRLHAPGAPESYSAVALLGRDDISFCNNQIEVENEVPFVDVGTFASSATLRMAHNRFQERPGGARLSASTFAELNQTALNQSTHCIYATGPAVVQPYNQTLTGNCGRFDQVAITNSIRYARRAGVGHVVAQNDQVGVAARTANPETDPFLDELAYIDEMADWTQLAHFALSAPLIDARAAQMEYEVARLAARRGDDDAEVIERRASVDSARARFGAFRTELARARVQPGSFDEAKAGLSGLVLQRGEPLHDATVIAYAGGRRASFACTSEGGFSLEVPADEAVILSVVPKEGGEAYRDREGVTLAPGQRIFRTIDLDAAPAPCQEPPEPAVPPDPAEDPGFPMLQLIGQPEAAAHAAIAAQRLMLSERSEKPAPDKAGLVIEQTPTARTKVKAGQAVTIVIGGDDRVAVPSVIGRSLEDARLALAQAELTLGDTSRVEVERQVAGRVVNQTPGEGERVARRTSVNLEIGVAKSGAEPPSLAEIVLRIVLLAATRLGAPAEGEPSLAERLIKAGLLSLAALERLIDGDRNAARDALGLRTLQETDRVLATLRRARDELR
jgi:hypothetical protein